MLGKNLTFFVVFVGLLFLMAFSSSVFGYNPSVATYTWSPGVPNYNASVVIHPGTLDISQLTMGDFLGVSSTQPTTGYGDSGVSVNWDDTWRGGVGNGNTNGDKLDGLWVQIYSTGGWWDLGSPTDKVVVFTSQDHGPYLGEGLEYRVYGSNTLWDNSSLSSQATLTNVYLDGWRSHNRAEDGNRNGWCSDDIAGVYQLPGNYRYIKLVAWGGGSYTEPEIDAVASVGIKVEIDIKPGSDPNSINLKSKGVIPVAILTTKDFDAASVDGATVTFGPASAKPVHGEGHLEDVNGDKKVDWVGHFKTQETGIKATDKDATINGKTKDGKDFTGKDSVNIVGGAKGAPSLNPKRKLTTTWASVKSK